MFNLFGSDKKVIPLPAKLKTDIYGFSYFSEMLESTSEKALYVFDFSKVEWFDANLCAVLVAVVSANRKVGAQFDFKGLDNPKYYHPLNNIGLLSFLKRTAHEYFPCSAIPIKQFDMKDENAVERYIYDNVFAPAQMPDMSQGAKRKVFRSIFEIYQNSVMHSNADNLVVCGQYFHFRAKLALTMVETGRTFKENVRGHDPKFANFSGKEALEWAVEPGNTTKGSHETGGLGLDLIRSFLRLNDGKLQILSDDGYWEEKKGVNLAEACTSSFKGSIVNIEFNLRDSYSYSTPEELDIQNIL